MQKSGKSINTNAQKKEKFIGMQMAMSLISLPSYTLYWPKDLRIDCIADTMGIKRYELIRRYWHANDNTKKQDDSSKLFKIESVLQSL